ncbi:hypothetical protein GUJ93_ZPchr0011g27449 [Zizania palustris]|uniref:MADS-box domain-containing protein n=1 Tax=Zizania palustris TaxID=103762 RepID=A0A8J6BTJ0_ZIZPA|nr:hypothetical protein GUJ93_ZPchr0011g27449 [Zizania palustris]
MTSLVSFCSLKALKKTFKKLDHDVNIQDFFGSGGQTVEELSGHLGSLQCQTEEAQKRLSYWSDPDKVDNIDRIRAMEQSLTETLHRIRIHKENDTKPHMMSLQCAQFQNDMQLPLGLSGDPNASSWFINGGGTDGLKMDLPEDPSLLHQRGDIVGCSTNASLQSYPDYFSMMKHSADNNTCGEHQNPAMQQPEFSQTDCLTSLQLGAQFPYQLAFDHASLFTDRLFRQDMEELHDSAAAAAAATATATATTMDFSEHYDLQPRPGDEASFQNWASTACGVTMYDHQQQQPQPPPPAQLPSAAAAAAVEAPSFSHPSPHQQLMIG